VLVEKPLVAGSAATLRQLKATAARTGAACYTAYNHRFEPHLASVRALLGQNRVGRIYHCRMFYGNGTARDVRNSAWRDRGMGAVPDLASHMLDLCAFFGIAHGPPRAWLTRNYENQACDHFLIGFPDGLPAVTLEGSLLSWRNTFSLDLVGEFGSIHVTGLCKWGPTSLVVRERKLPSGKPDEAVVTLEQPDPTWADEYRHFREVCATGATNIDTDIWIGSVLYTLSEQDSREAIA
jgi:scyllo-inositol 2-dehydrogenase (NADP+)